MAAAPERFDAVVVGGGFYGCCVAAHLRRERGLARVAVVERGPRLLGRASYGNQARVHQGYHYPRDFTTAYRSRVSFRRWVERYGACVDDAFLKLYAVASRNSLVTARQFARMMAEVGAPCRPAGRKHAALFSPTLVEAAFEVEEFAFNADLLAAQLSDDMEHLGVRVLLGTEVVGAERLPGEVRVLVRGAGGEERWLAGASAFNCTYGRLLGVPGLGAPKATLKYEICEIALVEPPEALSQVGVTLMDGPFFSCMPFPARGLHSLTHVRYTPHRSWTSDADPAADPYAALDAHGRASHFDLMARDASRYMPILQDARHRDSVFEVKVVLMANESNDGRPILIDGSPKPGGVVSILGGKVDNVFDVLSEIDARSAS